jgi:hypothetical protein
VPELNNLNYVSLPSRRAQSTIREKNENRQKLKSTVNISCGEVFNEHIHERNASNKLIELRLNGNGILVKNKKFWTLKHQVRTESYQIINNFDK